VCIFDCAGTKKKKQKEIKKQQKEKKGGSVEPWKDVLEPKEKREKFKQKEKLRNVCVCV
jgi:hypothetical protein